MNISSYRRDDQGTDQGHEPVIFGNGEAHGQSVDGCGYPLHQQSAQAQPGCGTVILAAAAALRQHFAADEAQQSQGDPGNELLKGAEILNNGVDTDPACHRHQGLEPRKYSGNAQHPPPGHAGLVESVGQRHGKRIHGKAHAQQHTVEKEQDIPLHDCFSS